MKLTLGIVTLSLDKQLKHGSTSTIFESMDLVLLLLVAVILPQTHPYLLSTGVLSPLQPAQQPQLDKPIWDVHGVTMLELSSKTLL